MNKFSIFHLLKNPVVVNIQGYELFGIYIWVYSSDQATYQNTTFYEKTDIWDETSKMKNK